MQVSANSTAATGAHDISGSAASSLFGAHGAGSAAKKAQLPPFAAVLTEQSAGEGITKEPIDPPLAKADDDADVQQKDVSPGRVHTKLHGLVSSQLQQAESLAGAEDGPQSADAATPKDEATPARRKTTPSASAPPSRKEKQGAEQNADLVSTVAVPVPVLVLAVQPVAVVPEKSPHPSPVPSQPSSTALQNAFMDKGHNEGLHVEAPAPAQYAETVTTDAILSPAPDSGGHGSDSKPVAPLQPSALSSPAISSAAGVQAARELPHQRLEVSAGSGPAGVATTAPSTAPVAQAAGMTMSAAALPKPKLQDKQSGDAVRGQAVSGILGGASSTGPAPSHSVALPIALSSHPVDAVGAKPADALTGANALQHLDAGEAPATLLHSSPHQIAVGVHDPALGWLEVQAQSSSGHVSATLTGASTEAHASLAAQAPAIAQYLADRNVSVHSVNVHTQADAQSGSSGGGQPQPDSGGARPEAQGQRYAVAKENIRPLASETGTTNVQQAESASYISVRA